MQLLAGSLQKISDQSPVDGTDPHGQMNSQGRSWACTHREDLKWKRNGGKGNVQNGHEKSLTQGKGTGRTFIQIVKEITMVQKIATDKLRTCESRCAGFVHNCSDFHRIELIFTRRLEKTLASIGSRLRYRLLTLNCRNLRKRTVDSAPCADLRRICMGLGNLSLISLPTQQNGGWKPWQGLFLWSHAFFTKLWTKIEVYHIQPDYWYYARGVYSHIFALWTTGYHFKGPLSEQGIQFHTPPLPPSPSPHPPIPYSHLERTHSRRSVSHRKKLITYFQPLRTQQTVPPLHVSRPAPPPPSPQCTNAYVLRPLTSECTPSSLWLKETGLYNFQGSLSKFLCSTPPGTVPHHWHTGPSDQWGARITRYNWCARW